MGGVERGSEVGGGGGGRARRGGGRGEIEPGGPNATNRTTTASTSKEPTIINRSVGSYAERGWRREWEGGECGGGRRKKD